MTEHPHPIPVPPGVRWLRFALWALLLMVLLGLVSVWWWGSHSGGPPPPVIAELPDFALTERNGTTVHRADLLGRPTVVDLIFTRCQLSCPLMTQRMKALGEDLRPEVRRLSISVDPTYDTPAVLARYATREGADGSDWLFVTGSDEDVRRLAIEGLKLGVMATPADDPRARQEPVTHSTRFVLVDAVGRVRGYYDGFDGAEVQRLIRDSGRLVDEATAGNAGVPR
jgi:protein SCO1/2